MSRTNFNELLEAGVHFGHLRRKWNPNMAPYIFMERNGIHIIDLHKTVVKIEEAASAMKQIAKSGRKVLFVATKKQAKDLVAEKVKRINMPYVTERWPGGMLTNFPTIRKAVKKMSTIDRMSTDGTFENLSKREKLQIARQRAKLEKNLGSIVDLTRLPAAMFIVDVSKEHIAVREAKRLNIPVFAIVDTNSDPSIIDFPIPANDDASNSISLILDIVVGAISEGLEERKTEKDKEKDNEPEIKKRETTRHRTKLHSRRLETQLKEPAELIVEAVDNHESDEVKIDSEQHIIEEEIVTKPVEEVVTEDIDVKHDEEIATEEIIDVKHDEEIATEEIIEEKNNEESEAPVKKTTARKTTKKTIKKED